MYPFFRTLQCWVTDKEFSKTYKLHFPNFYLILEYRDVMFALQVSLTYLLTWKGRNEPIFMLKIDSPVGFITRG